MNPTVRSLTASLLAPLLKLTGFRFSKQFRWGSTRAHRLVFALVDTVAANQKAGIEVLS